MNSKQLSLFEEQAEKPNLVSFQGLLWLDDGLSYEITKIKKEIKKEYGTFKFLNSRPHISAFEFTLPHNLISKLYHSLSEVLAHLNPPIFNVGKIKDWPSNGLLFLEVLDRIEFNRFNYKIYSSELLKYYQASLKFSENPHVTIGLFSKNWDVFNEVVKTYSGKDFQKTFKSTKLGIRLQEKETSKWFKSPPDLEIGNYIK
ncbi:2'-5' RNA ligase family protein [Jiulongibacter sediminis]|uniref:2'-5' RNA ligase family protein n=1 Tax=Jiulongibacter sediminis TaxID=1605367 RepID=UPI0026F0B089|nr:2'-5' RNA ligase family protein [Jiulongibacter sediminis]